MRTPDRNARLMELDPKYADVVVRRWQEYTGKTAILHGDGRSFDKVSQERVNVAAWIDQCHREIAAVEAEIRSGNPDLQGLCLALSDWSEELRILQNEQRRR